MWLHDCAWSDPLPRLLLYVVKTAKSTSSSTCTASAATPKAARGICLAAEGQEEGEGV